MPAIQSPKLNMCECGDLHLTYQTVTLHFAREEFLHFAVQLNRIAMDVSRKATHQHKMALTNTKGQNFH